MTTTETVHQTSGQMSRAGNEYKPREKGSRVKRLNINLPEKTFNSLEELARESGRSMTEIVRLALGLVQLALNEEGEGRKLAVIEPNGKVIKEVVLLS